MGPNAGKPCPFLRISYVVSTEVELEVGIKRLADLLRSYQTQQKPPLTEFLMDTPPISIPMDREEVI